MTTVLTRTTTAVDEAIEDFFAERIARARGLGPHYESLWAAARDASRGGKKLRPRLVLDAHDAFGGSRADAAVTVAAALELLHTAFLMHDDVIDRDLVRRGRPNLAGAFTAAALGGGMPARRATEWGEASALLAGDLLISAAHGLIAGLEVSARAELIAVVDESIFLAAAGEHADVAFSSGAATSDREGLLLMMENKTASYSFAAPLKAGAVLAGAGEAPARALDDIGRRLGIVFQLRDDVLGVFGAEARTGKSTLGDLREGKRTFLIACAEEHAEWTAVRHLFGDPELGDAGARLLRNALVESGALETVENLIAERLAALLHTIDRSGLPEHLRDGLAQLGRRCAERDS